MKIMSSVRWIPGIKIIAMIATDKLASSIYLNAETKSKWYQD
jgi:hypothetical protein